MKNFQLERWLSRNSEIVHGGICYYFRPITYAFMIFGFDIRFDLGKEGVATRPRSSSLMFLARIAYNAISIVMCLWGGVFGIDELKIDLSMSKLENGTSHIVKGVTFWSNFVIFCVLLRHQHRLSGFLSRTLAEVEDIVEEHENSSSNYKTSIKRAFVGCYLWLVVVSVWKCLYLVQVTAIKVSNDLPERHFLGISCSVFLKTSNLVYFFVCVFLYLMSCTFMVTMCLLLVFVSANLEVIGKTSISVTCSNVLRSGLQRFLKIHKAACKRLRALNEQFSFYIFVWFSNEFVGITCSLRTVTNPGFSVFQRTTYLILLSLFLMSFMTKWLLISSVNSKIVQVLEVVHIDDGLDFEITHQKLQRSMLHKVKFAFHAYCQEVLMFTPSISGWGLFSIDKHFLLAVFGTSFAYTVILHTMSN